MKKHLISMAATVILLTACGGAKKTNTAEADNLTDITLSRTRI